MPFWENALVHSHKESNLYAARPHSDRITDHNFVEMVGNRADVLGIYCSLKKLKVVLERNAFVL